MASEGPQIGGKTGIRTHYPELTGLQGAGVRREWRMIDLPGVGGRAQAVYERRRW